MLVKEGNRAVFDDEDLESLVLVDKSSNVTDHCSPVMN